MCVNFWKMIQRGGIFELFCGARIANFGYGYLLEDLLVPTYVTFAVLRCKCVNMILFWRELLASIKKFEC